jgi:hypothetical protein
MIVASGLPRALGRELPPAPSLAADGSPKLVAVPLARAAREAQTGLALAEPEDQRITPVGALLCRPWPDELHQIWNVLCGQMSLVGPWPEQPEFVAELRNLPDFDLRHLIRPGLTGIGRAQRLDQHPKRGSGAARSPAWPARSTHCASFER